MQTINEVVGFLKQNGTNCRYVSLVTETQPKMKPGCPFSGVVKVSRKRGIVNLNYNTAVRRRLAKHLGVKLKEVEYTDGEVWYRHLTTADGQMLPLVVNKNVQTPSEATEHYLQFFTSHSKHSYRLPNGNAVTAEELKPWFAPQAERPHFKPAVISVKVSNIKKMRASVVLN
jgi:hypothetical protein